MSNGESSIAALHLSVKQPSDSPPPVFLLSSSRTCEDGKLLIEVTGTSSGMAEHVSRELRRLSEELDRLQNSGMM